MASVSTYGSEIHRMTGDEVQQVLAAVVKLWKAMDEEAKPRILVVSFCTQEAGGVRKEVGTMRAHLVKPGGRGPVEVRIEPNPDFAILPDEASLLAQELVNKKVVGRLGRYEWRVE